MENNFELLTTQELQLRVDGLVEVFEQARKQMLDSHEIMLTASNQLNEIKQIIEKRGGKL